MPSRQYGGATLHVVLLLLRQHVVKFILVTGASFSQPPTLERRADILRSAICTGAKNSAAALPDVNGLI